MQHTSSSENFIFQNACCDLKLQVQQSTGISIVMVNVNLSLAHCNDISCINLCLSLWTTAPMFQSLFRLDFSFAVTFTLTLVRHFVLPRNKFSPPRNLHRFNRNKYNKNHELTWLFKLSNP